MVVLPSINTGTSWWGFNTVKAGCLCSPSNTSMSNSSTGRWFCEKQPKSYQNYHFNYDTFIDVLCCFLKTMEVFFNIVLFLERNWINKICVHYNVHSRQTGQPWNMIPHAKWEAVGYNMNSILKIAQISLYCTYMFIWSISFYALDNKQTNFSERKIFKKGH